MMTWEAEARLKVASELIWSIAEDHYDDLADHAHRLRRIVSEIRAVRESLIRKAPRLDESVVVAAREVRGALNASPHDEIIEVWMDADEAREFVAAMGLDDREGSNK